MRVGRVLSIAVVSVAGLIVIVAAAIAITFFVSSRSGNQQNFAPSASQQAVSPLRDVALFSQNSGSSSLLYRKNLTTGAKVRLTGALSGIESEASFSPDGKLVVYSFAKSPDSKSEVWLVDADGQNPHRLTGNDEDALHPVFSPDGSKVFYAASRFTGHYSPIVRPARHDWDVFSIPVQSKGALSDAPPARMTHAFFYDLQSLDAAAYDGETLLLISTSGYPIGALLEEFNLGATGRNKIFQPHVLGEPSTGAEFGEARFIHEGMDILFLAATNTSGGNFDYNVFTMSEVTGGEIKQLTHLKGMTAQLKVLPDGKASFVNGGVAYVLDINAHTVRPL